MGVSIIRGAISSGKSDMCLKQISEIHEKNPDSKCIMIVPDHYSYETERKFVDFFGGIGLNNIEVLTLRRMSINFLSAKQQNHLTAPGKMMLIYKAVSAACDELLNVKDMDIKLITSMRQQGFLDVMSSLISEMKRYLITPEILFEKANALTDNKTLKNKLIALSNVLEKYLSYVEESGCTDSEDDLFYLANRIENGTEFDENTYIWVNRFDKFMPQQICVLEALLKKGVHMTISVCCPVTEYENEREIYLQTEKTVQKVYELSQTYGLENEYTASDGLRHLKGKDDLYKLFRYWTEDFVYPDKPKNTALFQSRDTYGEIERIACKIVDLVRDDGYRFKDIALLCGDENDYRHLIEAVFSEYEIPYFTDRTIILSDHPIAMQILSLFSILEDDWSYDSVFRYLRAGFIYRKEQHGKLKFFKSINQEEIDILENFVLKHGIRGGSKWLGEKEWLGENNIVDTAFQTESEEDTNEVIEKLRHEITAPIASFKEKTKGRKTAAEFATALFEYLEDINLYAGLKSDIDKFQKDGKLNESEQFTKIWNLILDILNQVTIALDGDKINISEFAEYITVGLSQCEIRTIPSGIDQVYVGSVERSSHTSVKVMFIVGAKSGTFPTGIASEGFLSNRDRCTLQEEYGVTLAPDTKKKLDEQYFKVYRALCAVSEKLYFSYSIQNEEGKSQSPSHMINDIMRKFPKMTVSDNLLNDPLKDGIYISTPQATIHRMLINMSDRFNGSKNQLWEIVYDWYKHQTKWKPMLLLMKRADYYSERGVMLDSDIANMMYDGKITYSATRINAYAACPFQYFLRYGLNAQERDVWEVNSSNIGTYAHEVIRQFCDTVEDGANTNEDKIDRWRNLTDEKRNNIIGGIINESCNNLLSSDVRDKERTANIFTRMGKTISNAAILVQKTLSAGNFAENGMEYDFEEDISDAVALKGKIDRIDICRDGDKSFLRIIDYKTGKTVFDIKNIYNGYNMQMVIYAIAAKIKNSDTDVTGIYYTGVRDEIKELNAFTTEENIVESNKNALKLDGVTFTDEDEQLQTKLLYNMDNKFLESGQVSFTNIKSGTKTGFKEVHTKDEINGLMKYVSDTIIEMDRDIRNGKISLNPYTTSNTSVCDYCSYSPVCKFDKDNCTPRIADSSVKKEDIWEILKTKGAALKNNKSKGVDKDA